MNLSFMRYALFLVLGLALSACGGSGSCVFPSGAGYDYCKDYLGSEFNRSNAQNDCTNGQPTVGTWSSGPCSTASALGYCSLWPDSTAINFTYTYTASNDGSPGAPAGVGAVQTACGISGGTFSTSAP
jgi:hypothetical protein